MFKRFPYLPVLVALVVASVAAAPAMATDEVTAPPVPPSTVAPSAPTCTDTSKPAIHISTSPAGAARKHAVRGTSSDLGCGPSGRGSVAYVAISVQRKQGKHCRYMSSKGKLSSTKSCASPVWLRAHGTGKWSFGLSKKLPRGTYNVRVHALDSAGNVSAQRSLRVRVR
jgi:Bacterial Ig-like domain